MTEAQTSIETQIRSHATNLISIGKNGLVFTDDVFDRQRYEETTSIGIDLMSMVSAGTPTQLAEIVAVEKGYMTPKLDVRGAVFDDTGHILLIRDRSDEKWTLPGGWVDPGQTAGEAVVREVQEESGLVVRATKLVAALDRDTQGHQPKFPYHVTKMFFLCERIADGKPSPIETMEVDWFSIDALPELSTTRTLPSQIQLMHDHWQKPELPTVFD
ncbi:NUDIX hydrolase N-terminal domain-containing protein [Nocardia suismassiliense]|uniref:NUDIX hydrolase N-terminal domain-containing protein n=1 Tax=Nocardia suismassiliense TaxID=2077092 RepID=A0ABW6QSA3_9NOCA